MSHYLKRRNSSVSQLVILFNNIIKLTLDSLFFSLTFILCLSLVVLNSKILLLIDIQFYHTVHKFHYLLLTTICLLTEYKIRTNKLENPINFLISHKSIRYIQFIQISPICPRKRERKKSSCHKTVVRGPGPISRLARACTRTAQREESRDGAERKRSPIIHEAMSSALSVIVHIFVASALSLTGMADVQLSPYEPPKSQFRLFVKAIEFGRCCSNSVSVAAIPRHGYTCTHNEQVEQNSRLCLETRGSEPGG